MKIYIVYTNFNLWLLNKEYDIHPRSWICIRGKGIKELIIEMENNIKNENNISREKLSKNIAKKYKCSHNTIKQKLQHKSLFYPIPLIIEMALLCKEGKKYLKKIHNRIRFLKVNSSDSKPIKALKFLNKDLAKILGAFMADGCLTQQIIISSKNKKKLKKATLFLRNKNIKFSNKFVPSRKEFSLIFSTNHNNFNKINKFIKKLSGFQIRNHLKIEIIDEHKTNLDAFNNWLFNCFKLKPTIFKERKNAWRCVITNKILARYFVSFFDIKPGCKTTTAFEPQIIRYSSKSVRNMFARGLIMFDGCVTLSGKIYFETKSKYLINSLKEIFKIKKIRFGTRVTENSFIIYTYKNNKINLLGSFFEPRTIKWFKIKEVYSESLDKNLSKYKVYPKNKVSFPKIVEILNNVKICDINFLKNHFTCSHYSVTNYLNILKNNKIINLTKNPKNIIAGYVDTNTKILIRKSIHKKIFNLIKENFVTYQIFGKRMNIHKATISAWKLRKNKIPLSTLKRICDTLEINFSEILNNIEKTDRQIIELFDNNSKSFKLGSF